MQRLADNDMLGLLLKSSEVLTKNDHIQHLTIGLSHHSDIIIIFDHFPSLQYLDISTNKPFMNIDVGEDIVNGTYDFDSLPLKLLQLRDFTLKTYGGSNIDYKIFEKIIKNLIYLNKLSIFYIRSDLSSRISGHRIDQMLSNLTNLKENFPNVNRLTIGGKCKNVQRDPLVSALLRRPIPAAAATAATTTTTTVTTTTTATTTATTTTTTTEKKKEI
ncbi:unnamed protein product [Didymodactylos carnosus]|uniref:Uncharacterized protein n=1 Tax=Didymodactylos carnosus TaxID=1234261 RepID=A0A8S2Q019_9BILA|nr:unnamed protein product [Didymodactylos carnosus]